MNKFGIGLLVITLSVLYACSKGTSKDHVATVTTTQPNNTRPAPAQPQASKPEKVPAHYTKRPARGELPPTLSPDLFWGNQRLAYEVARRIPETLAQLPCYCHCDDSLGHKSLQSCFVTEHGESCGICIGEALMASQLEKQKVPIEEIRRQIIAAYSSGHKH